MAVMNVTYMSTCLKRYVDFKVILPIEQTGDPIANYKNKPDKFKTVYLLHGFSGNSSDWLINSRISKIARDRNIAVVMPSGENSFYVDHEKRGIYYGSFVGEELVNATRKMFPLSNSKEDTFIAGLSMGGFGSLLVGCQFAETFGGIISLSGGFVLEDILQDKQPDYLNANTREYYESVFGDLNEVLGSNKDPLAVASKAKKQGYVPLIYMACGSEDYLFERCKETKNALLKSDIEVKWIQDKGAHDWVFWDKYIEKSIDWMLENTRDY